MSQSKSMGCGGDMVCGSGHRGMVDMVCGMVDMCGHESLNMRGGARRQSELEVKGGGGSTTKSCRTGSSHK